MKARSKLLMALPNEHLMTFNQYKDAKTLFAAIQTRFGGNEATKKTQKPLLKKMYENFSALSIESLDSIFNGFQKIKTGRKITINGSDTARYDKSKVNYFNCHKMGHFARECREPRNQDSRNRNQDSSRRTVNVEKTSFKAMVAIDGAGFDWSYMADDEVLTNMAIMVIFTPNLDLSNSGLEEFQQPEFEGYGPKTSKIVNEDTSNEVRESPDAPMVEKLVLDDKLEKKTFFPTDAKIEFVRPKQHEKPVRKPVKYAEMYRS
ncbi:ribonuclease H-like domain-containing protein [Tanacetum coccineum]